MRKRSLSTGDLPLAIKQNVFRATSFRKCQPRPHPINKTVSRSSILPRCTLTSICDDDTILVDTDEVEEYIFDNCDFPFINLAFEGGGNKGMAYVGSIEVGNSNNFFYPKLPLFLLSNLPKASVQKKLSVEIIIESFPV